MSINERHASDFTETLTKEQRREALGIMARQFKELLERPDRDNLYWMGTKTDLVDLVHEVYMTESIVDGQGRPFGFVRILERACAVLHVVMPCNPYSMAFNARNRKGVRQTSMFSRFCWMMYNRKNGHPLKDMVERMGTSEK